MRIFPTTPDHRAGVFASLIISLLATVANAAASGFLPQQTFTTGSQPVWVSAVDVNGDGKADLVVSNHTDSTLGVLINTTADGATTLSFAAQRTFPVGSEPFGNFFADVNGDSKPDLIVANQIDNTISVLINTTAVGAAVPSFATQLVYGTGADPLHVIAGDINGDGKPDLITPNNNDDTISVLLNTTTGGITTFAAQQTFAAGGSPRSVAVADVNGDGKLDLIVANGIDNTISVLLNTTATDAIAASFSTQQTFSVGVTPLIVTLADFDGNGKMDITVANFGDNTISTLLNATPVGSSIVSFLSQQISATGSYPLQATAVDLNGDGKPDVIAANQYSNTVSVFINAFTDDFIFSNGFE